MKPLRTTNIGFWALQLGLILLVVGLFVVLFWGWSLLIPDLVFFPILIAVIGISLVILPLYLRLTDYITSKHQVTPLNFFHITSSLFSLFDPTKPPIQIWRQLYYWMTDYLPLEGVTIFEYRANRYNLIATFPESHNHPDLMDVPEEMKPNQTRPAIPPYYFERGVVWIGHYISFDSHYHYLRISRLGKGAFRPTERDIIVLISICSMMYYNNLCLNTQLALQDRLLVLDSIMHKFKAILTDGKQEFQNLLVYLQKLIERYPDGNTVFDPNDLQTQIKELIDTLHVTNF